MMGIGGRWEREGAGPHCTILDLPLGVGISLWQWGTLTGPVMGVEVADDFGGPAYGNKYMSELRMVVTVVRLWNVMVIVGMEMVV